MHSSQTLQAWFIRPSPMKHTQPHRVRWWGGSAEQIQPTWRRIRKQCPKVWDMAMPSPYLAIQTFFNLALMNNLPARLQGKCGETSGGAQLLSPASQKLRTHHNSHQNMTWINSWLTWLKWIQMAILSLPNQVPHLETKAVAGELRPRPAYFESLSSGSHSSMPWYRSEKGKCASPTFCSFQVLWNSLSLCHSLLLHVTATACYRYVQHRSVWRAGDLYS